MSENANDINKIEGLTLGSLPARGPQDILDMAADIKAKIAPIINEQQLYTIMERTDRKTGEVTRSKHVNAEGWALLGGAIGVVSRTVSTTRMEEGKGWSATVELVRVTDGAVVGRGDAMCGIDEGFWARNDEFARKAMSQTRAASRAYRMTYGWIMKLAGFEATASEEMPEGLTSKPESPAEPPQPAQDGRSANNGNTPPAEPVAPQKAAESKRPDAVMDIPTLIAWFHDTMNECPWPHADKALEKGNRVDLGRMLSGQFPNKDDRHNFQFVMTGFNEISDGMTYRAMYALQEWMAIPGLAAKEAQAFLDLEPDSLADLVSADTDDVAEEPAA